MSTNKEKICNIILVGTSIIYFFIMIDCLFLKKDYSLETLFSDRKINIIPLKTLAEYINYICTNNTKKIIEAKNNLIGNVVIFFPLGIYLSLLKNIKHPLISVVFFSFTAEIIQFTFNLGIFDIDDIILNTIGGAIGIIVIKILTYLIKNTYMIKFFIMSTALLVLAILLFDITINR